MASYLRAFIEGEQHGQPLFSIARAYHPGDHDILDTDYNKNNTFNYCSIHVCRCNGASG